VLVSSLASGGVSGTRSATAPPPLTPHQRLPAYAEEAPSYERRTRLNQDWRDLLTRQLPLHSGDVVLDVGCGSGLCFPMLRSKVGARGGIVGIDESPQMVHQAHGRVADRAWRNVTLLTAPVQDAQIPVTADAALFCAVHDILQSPAALRNVFRHLRPGAWVAAGGGKWAAPWLVPLNLATFALHQPFIRDFRGFDRPWRLLEKYLVDVRVTEVAFGTGYVVVGRARARIPRPRAAPDSHER